MPDSYDISVFLGYIFAKVRNSKHHKNITNQSISKNQLKISAASYIFQSSDARILEFSYYSRLFTTTLSKQK